VLATGATRALDLGDAGGRTFIGIASCGFDSDANRIANETRLVRGNVVYLYGALRAVLAWRPATFIIERDDEEPEIVLGYTFVAANSKAYGGGMYMAPDASLEDGLLDIVTVGDMSKLRFVRGLPAVFKGEHVHQPGVLVRQAAQVRVSADRPFTMYADGDPIAELPVTIRTLRGAVRVIVPE
jgi:diacylglycerol kinase family enzyme